MRVRRLWQKAGAADHQIIAIRIATATIASASAAQTAFLASRSLIASRAAVGAEGSFAKLFMIVHGTLDRAVAIESKKAPVRRGL